MVVLISLAKFYYCCSLPNSVVTQKHANLFLYSFLIENEKFPTENSSLIRRFKSLNSINTATSMGTSINSIPSEVNQYEIEEDDDDFEIVEITRL